MTCKWPANDQQITCNIPANICNKPLAIKSSKSLSAILSLSLPSDASLFEQTCFSQLHVFYDYIFKNFIFPALLIFTQTFEYLCVIVTMVGFCFEAWFSIIWTLTYDLFSISEAPDVSGILFFCRGISTLIVPLFQTLILEATTKEILLISLETTSSLTFSTVSTSNSFTSQPLVTTENLLTTMASNTTNYSNFEGRSFGNQMVMTMLCGLVSLATFFQLIMYFLVINNFGVKKAKENETNLGHANNAFE